MARKISMLAPDWWDYTTLDDDILRAYPNNPEQRNVIMAQTR